MEGRACVLATAFRCCSIEACSCYSVSTCSFGSSMFRVAHSGDSDFGAQSLKANQAFTKPAQQGATPGTSTHLAKSSQATEQLSLSLVFVLVLSD